MAQTGSLDVRVESLFEDLPLEGTSITSSAALCDALQARNLSRARDLLYMPSWMLRDWLLIPELEADRIIARAFEACAAKPVSAWEMALQFRRPAARTVQLPLPTLASLTGGLAGIFMEIVGPPGVGKTQLCMHAAALTAAAGLEVFWLDTEGAFSPQRALQVLLHTFLQQDSADGAMDNELEAMAVNALERIRVRPCASLHEVHTVALDLKRRAQLLEPVPALVIVDSVASVARNEGDVTEKRSSWVPKRQSALNALAATFKALVGTVPPPEGSAPAVLVANQVAGDPASGRAKPSLGHVWHHAVNWRLLLHHLHPAYIRGSGSKVREEFHEARCEQMRELCRWMPTRELPLSTQRRALVVEKSPCAGQLVIEWEIRAGGLVEVSGDGAA